MRPNLEVETRQLIDWQITATEWQVVSLEEKAQHSPHTPIAICEDKLETGRADYILYLDGKACGVIEHPTQHSLQGIQERSMSYATFRNWQYPDTCWQSHLPFRFQANGWQIQFTDAPDPQSRARNIFHFPKPERLRNLLTKAVAPDDTLCRRLHSLPVAMPLGEQSRIVARITEHFLRLNAGVAALRHTKAHLQRYRQSVLAAAVTAQITRSNHLRSGV